MKHRLLAVLILSLLVSVAALAGGGEKLSSPRAKANRIKVETGEQFETMDRSFQYGSPRAIAREASVKTTKTTTKDTLNRSNVGITAKIKSQRVSKMSDRKPESDK